LLAEGHTPHGCCAPHVSTTPGAELVARFQDGFGAALELLLAGRLDVALGRSEGHGQPFPTTQLARRLIRLEPLALLLPQEHPLATLDRGAAGGGGRHPGGRKRRQHPGAGMGRPRGAPAGGVRRPAKPTPSARRRAGRDGAAAPARRRPPILTLSERPLPPGVVVRPLTDPVPLYPWTMAHHRELRHPALDALHAAADQLARREGWLEPPPDHWLPDPDTAAFGLS
jgi:hypothetical protein